MMINDDPLLIGNDQQLVIDEASVDCSILLQKLAKQEGGADLTAKYSSNI